MNRIAELEKELKLAKADLKLVDRSRTEMLAAVRATVAEEQASTVNDLIKLQEELDRAKQTTSMQLSQINSLLLDKVDLQSQGIAYRDATSKNNINDEKASTEVVMLRAEVKQLEESLEQTKEQLKKARNFIRQQDKLFKEQHQAQANVRVGSFSDSGVPLTANFSLGCQRKSSA